MKVDEDSKSITQPMSHADRETFDKLMQLDLDDSNSATACRASVATLVDSNKEGFLAALAGIDKETRTCLEQYIAEVERDQAGTVLSESEQREFDALIKEIERHTQLERPKGTDDEAEVETEDDLQDRILNLIGRNPAGCRKAIGELDADRKALMVPDPDELLHDFDEEAGLVERKEF